MKTEYTVGTYHTCNLCKRGFINLARISFNPIGYVPGLCSECNADILKQCLKKGHCIIKTKVLHDLLG